MAIRPLFAKNKAIIQQLSLSVTLFTENSFDIPGKFIYRNLPNLCMQKDPDICQDLFTISYEGGDSEFINYLIHIIQIKCVQSMAIF